MVQNGSSCIVAPQQISLWVDHYGMLVLEYILSLFLVFNFIYKKDTLFLLFPSQILKTENKIKIV